MGIISKAVVAGSLTFYSLLGGKFCYQEWNLRKTLPKEEILIGEKDEKKAVVIGTYYDRFCSLQYVRQPSNLIFFYITKFPFGYDIFPI